jgi:hypothetical protein
MRYEAGQYGFVRAVIDGPVCRKGVFCLHSGGSAGQGEVDPRVLLPVRCYAD